MMKVKIVLTKEQKKAFNKLQNIVENGDAFELDDYDYLSEILDIVKANIK